MQCILLIIIALCAGILAAAGVAALITSTGVVTRIAGKSHTGHFVKGYETAIILGVIWWNIFWVLKLNLHLTMSVSSILQVFMGVFQGIFVGCLAVSLAEILNGTAIFARRVKLSRGIQFIVLFTALGKVIFSILQFLL